jgi:alpha-tubulin suppressor-like RCC1 family protein
MKDIENSKKEAPLLGLQGMGGGVGGFNFLSGGGEGGGIWGWGRNTRWFMFQAPAPQTPTNNALTYSSPRQIGTDVSWTRLHLGSQTDTYMALDSKNDLYVWGSNSYGALGQGQSVSYPFETSGATKALTASSQLPGTYKTIHSNTGVLFATKETDDGLFAWGNNRNGTLGQNTSGPGQAKSSPTRVPGTWSSAVLGGNDQFVSAMGVKTDGTLWTWGRDPFGKLGVPSLGPYPYDQELAKRYSSPIQVGTDTNWGKEINHITMGSRFSMAIKTDGTLWSWGRNESGLLGTNQGYSGNRSSPTQVGTSTNWAQILAQGYGAYRVFGVKTDGSLWGWGETEYGALGLNQPDSEKRSSPTQIPGTWKIGGCTNAGYRYTSWVKDDGTLWAWGYNANGQLGQNNTTTHSSPVQIGAGAKWLGATGGTANSVSGAWGAK